MAAEHRGNVLGRLRFGQKRFLPRTLALGESGKNVLALAKRTPGCDTKVGRAFALIHDAKRENENHDPEHGQRAAKYAKSLYKKRQLPLTTEQMDKLIYACHYHNDGLTLDDPTIGVCWDADRLDLPRVGIIPDPALLSTQAGRDLCWKV